MNMELTSLNNKSLLEFAGETVSQDVAAQGVRAVLETHNLNWNVVQKPVYSELGVIENTVANYRDDTNGLLGLVSNRYTVLDNYDAFSFIDNLEDFTFDRAGSSNGGRQVFIVGKTSEKFEIDTNDFVEEYVTFIHGHDGLHAIRLVISPIRTFCTNQLNVLINRNSFCYSIKHIGDIDSKLRSARSAMLKGSNYLNNLKNVLGSFRDSKLENFNISEFVRTLVKERYGTPISERQIRRTDIMVNEIIDLYRDKPDNQNYKNTKLGVLNAVSDFVSHQSPQRVNNADTNTNLFLNNIAGNKMLDIAYRMLLAA